MGRLADTERRSVAERAAGAVGRVIGSLGGGVVEGFRSEGRLTEMQYQPWYGDQGEPPIENLAANEKAYLTSVVYEAVYAIASQGAAVPLMMYRATDSDRRKWEKLPGHPILEHLQYPNRDAEETDFDLIEAFLSDWELSGNWYLYTIRDSDGLPLRSYRLRPAFTNPVPSKSRRIDHYRYAVNGEETIFTREEVGQSKTFNPFSDITGLSSLAAARIEVMTDVEAARWNLNYFRNNAIPPGYIEVEKGTKREVVDRMEEKLRKDNQGTKNAHRVGILTGAQFKPSGVTHDDMQFLEQRKFSREQILGCFHVPPAIVGVHEYSNYANLEGQLKAFWNLTMIPKLQKMERALTRILCRPYDKSLRLRFDMTGVWAVVESQREMAEVDRILTQSGIMTINERREERGLEPKPWGDKTYIQIQYVPIDEAGMSNFSPRALPNEPAQAPARSTPKPVAGRRMYQTKELAKGRELAWETVVAPSRRQFAKKVEALVGKQEAEVLANMGAERRSLERIRELAVGRAKSLAEGEPVTREMLKQAAGIEIESWLFDYDNWVTESERAVHATLLNATNTAGIFAIGEVGVDVEFNLADPNVQQAIREKEQVFAQTWNRSTLDSLRDTLSDGVLEGENKEELTARVREVFGHEKRNADVVAQTEVGASCNAGAQEGWAQSGVVAGKEWHAGGPNPRKHHIEANGQVVALDADFFVGGESLRYPGDPKGRADNVCNCHCNNWPVLKEV